LKIGNNSGTLGRGLTLCYAQLLFIRVMRSNFHLDDLKTVWNRSSG